MSTIHSDLIEGASVNLTPLGYVITSKKIVEGVTGNSGDQKIYNAITATENYIGEQHSIYSDSYLQSINCVALSSDTIEVACTYEPMTNVPSEIQISSRTTSAQTNKDVNDTPIAVSFTFPSDYALDPHRVGTTDTVGKTVDIQVPSIVINYKRREIETGNNLIDKSKAYLAKLNNIAWNLRPLDSAGEWLVSSLDSTLVGYIFQSGQLKTVYDVQYTFENQYGGWSTEVVYQDPNTGNPPDPDDWTEGVTQKTIDLYSNANFSALNLT